MRKDMKDMVNELHDDNIEIFGEHKTREEIKAEEKSRKQAERESMRRVAKARRDAVASAGGGATKKEIVTTAVAVGLILVLAVAALVVPFYRQHLREQEAAAFDIEVGRTYFINADATPTMNDEGVHAALTGAYYTQGGYIKVQLLLGNGTDTALQVESLDVVLYNDEADIASAKILDPTEDEGDGPLTVAAGETEYYEFFVHPDHVLLPDDSLQQVGLTYSIETITVE